MINSSNFLREKSHDGEFALRVPSSHLSYSTKADQNSRLWEYKDTKIALNQINFEVEIKAGKSR